MVVTLGGIATLAHPPNVSSPISVTPSGIVTLVRIADDALTTFAATFAGAVLLAPAMNPKMWSHSACADNVVVLKRRGVRFCGPVSGHVACGADGVGRMAEPAEILAAIEVAIVDL